MTKRRRAFFPHQREAFHYARMQKHPALFLEMRLGKTLVVIRRIQLYAPRDPYHRLHILIVAPNSALGTWKDELKKEGEKSVIYLQGKKADRRLTLAFGKTWNLINKEGFLALPEIAQVRWDAVVLDESTFVKNPQAKVTKFFLSNFRDVPHRWILTGMPNPQNDLEFWSQLAFLDGDAFGFSNYWAFRHARYQQKFGGYEWQPRPGTQSMVKRTVGARACVIRRADVDMDTERIYQVRRFTMPKKLRKTYDTAEKDFVLERSGVEVGKTIFALPAYQWMRRMCAGEVDGEVVWKAKYHELVRLLSNELRREKVVIWFTYNSQLYAVEKELRKHIPTASCLAVTGNVKPAVRRVYYGMWRKGKARLLLLQVRVAQMGLDFSAADTAIYFSSPASVSIRTQSEDRICHPQKKQAVLYIDFLCRDSVEEDLYYAVRKRRARSGRTLSRAVLYGMQKRRSDG